MKARTHHFPTAVGGKDELATSLRAGDLCGWLLRPLLRSSLPGGLCLVQLEELARQLGHCRRGGEPRVLATFEDHPAQDLQVQPSHAERAYLTSCCSDVRALYQRQDCREPHKATEGVQLAEAQVGLWVHLYLSSRDKAQYRMCSQQPWCNPSTRDMSMMLRVRGKGPGRHLGKVHLVWRPGGQLNL